MSDQRSPLVSDPGPTSGTPQVPALAGPVQVVGTLRPDTIERMLAKSDLELGLEALGVKPP